MSLFSHRDRKTPRRRRTSRPEFQATVEGLESRTVLSAAPITHHVAALVQSHSVHANQTQVPQLKQVGLTANNISITNVQRDAQNNVTAVSGVISATLKGTLNKLPISLPINVPFKLTSTSTSTSTGTVTPQQTGNILHLSLGPVNLNLLGLHVRLNNSIMARSRSTSPRPPLPATPC